MMFFTDRIWRPDRYCSPFHLEACNDAPTTRRLLEFSIQRGQLGVIRSIAVGGTAISVFKDVARIIIARQRPVDGDEEGSVSLNGALADVREYGGTLAGGTIPGFILAQGTGAGVTDLVPRPCCVPLMFGSYHVMQAGTHGPTSFQVALFGWTWPEEIDLIESGRRELIETRELE